MKLKRLEGIVREVLEQNPNARKDDFILIELVMGKFINTDMSFKSVCLAHKELGLPSLEGITRCRRKLQAENPELCDDDILVLRADEEGKFRQYALNLDI